MRRYTEELVRCAVCQRGNNFLILVHKDKETKQNYLSTQCPKCGHTEEFKAITAKEAKALEGREKLDPEQPKNDYF